MEFFGYSNNNEYSSPIEALIKAASEPLLLGPDWSLNMEICDAITSSIDGVDIAVNCLTRRFKEKDHQTAYLAAIVAETCMKNCPKFAAGVQARKAFMDEMVQLAKGTKGTKAQEEGLRLIKQWQIMFSKNQTNMPIFNETYSYLRDRGVVFPDSVDTVEPLPDQAAPAPQMSQQELAQKLTSDLKVVVDKARLCREMLPESPGIASDPALAEVVGYLEACRDRLMDLIEAGTMGMLDEEVLELCLKTNDVVCRTLEAEMNGIPVSELEDIDTIMSGMGAAAGGGAGAPPGTSAVSAVAFNMDDEDGGLSVKPKKKGPPVEAGKPKFSIKPLPAPPGGAAAKPKVPPAAPAKESSTTAAGEVDILGLSSPEVAAPPAAAVSDFDDFFNSSSSPAAAPPATGATASAAAMNDEDFDNFLNNLTASPNK